MQSKECYVCVWCMITMATISEYWRHMAMIILFQSLSDEENENETIYIYTCIHAYIGLPCARTFQIDLCTRTLAEVE